MNWFITKEERTAVITGVSTLIIASLIGGFHGGRGEVIELTKHHVKELQRQRLLLQEQAEKQKKELNLDILRKQAKTIIAARNALEIIKNKKPILPNIEDIKENINTLVGFEKMFDVIGFLRFTRDYGNKKSNQQFTHLLNKKANALYNLQVFVKNIPKHGVNISIEETNKIIEKLLILINEEAEASSAFYGSIEYASMKSLK